MTDWDALRKKVADQKDQRFHVRTPPTSWRILNGQHRRPSPKVHGNPSHGAGGGTGALLPGLTQQVTDTSVFPIYPTLFEPEPEPTIPYAGIRTGELTGYRMWWVCDAGLSSMAHPFIWKPGATIDGDINQIVDKWRSYLTLQIHYLYGGVYAYATKDDKFNQDLHGHIQQLLQGKYNDGFGQAYALVLGTVKLWGEVVEHEFGYRAQFAKMTSIDRVYYRDNDPDLIPFVDRILKPYREALNVRP